ncbi:hypothetical protein GX51_07540 [Blastomyces parvus]|uniref:Rhodopsin domain-containing protein n=1 Tax=Blastomyces parvus TaxID=2060905 RepID=A0A2B7WKF7_9EURO|nr:hypothetical protein GX51_07540 [Blastomyces parvus]
MVETIQPRAIALVCTFQAITFIFVGLRLYSRRIFRDFGWDDVLILIAFLLSIVHAVGEYAMIKYDFLGYHVWDVPPTTMEFRATGKLFTFIAGMSYNPPLSLIRASITLFLLRVAESKRTIRISLYLIFAANLLQFVVFFVVELCQCLPVKYFWDFERMDLAAQQRAGADKNGMKDGKLVTGGKCINKPRFYVGAAIVYIILDFWLLCLPIILLWNLNIPRRRKTTAVIVLSMGGVTAFLATTRLVIMKKQWEAPPGSDYTYTSTSGISVAEMNVGIWTAAAPALNHLFARLFPRIWKRYGHKSSSRSPGPDEQLADDTIGGHPVNGAKRSRGMGPTGGGPVMPIITSGISLGTLGRGRSTQDRPPNDNSGEDLSLFGFDENQSDSQADGASIIARGGRSVSTLSSHQGYVKPASVEP